MAVDLLVEFNRRVPKILFRGDQAERICKGTGSSVFVKQFKSVGLYTNLICNGDDGDVDRMGIRNSVTKHISGWPTSHYLSFTEDRSIAEYFAKGGDESKYLYETYEDDWDAVVFEFQKAIWKWKPHSYGIYVGYIPTNYNDNHYIALIDSVSILARAITEEKKPFEKELELATKYKEWLIIPLDQIDMGLKAGRTAQLIPGAVNATTFTFENNIP